MDIDILFFALSLLACVLVFIPFIWHFKGELYNLYDGAAEGSYRIAVGHESATLIMILLDGGVMTKKMGAGVVIAADFRCR
jgi:hypothetical protein